MKEERVRESYDRLLAIKASGETDRSTCLSPEALQHLLDRAGPDQERLRQLDHVMGCPFCLPEFELLRSVAKARPSPFLPRLTALAGGVTLLLAGAVFWRLEVLKQRNAMRGDEGGLPVVSPVPDARVPAPLSFVWRSVPEAAEYRIEVLTPAGDVVWQWSGKDTTASMPSSVALEAGADYRWAVVAGLTNGEQVRSAMQRFKAIAP